MIDTHKDKEELGAGIGYALHLLPHANPQPLLGLVGAYTGSSTAPASALLAKPLTKSPGIDDWAPLLSALQHP